MWRKLGVRVSKFGKLCVDDLCDIIQVSPGLVERYIISDDQKLINGNTYIGYLSLMNILVCSFNYKIRNFFYSNYKKLIEEVPFSFCEVLRVKVGNEFLLCYEIDGDKWFKEKDVSRLLRYKSRVPSMLRKEIFGRMQYYDLCLYYFHYGTVLMSENYIDKQTCFINSECINKLALTSNKSNSFQLCEALGIDIRLKFFRKEIEIVRYMNYFFDSVGIETDHLYTFIVDGRKYIIDYWIPKYRLAIEIDEHAHNDRDQCHEKKRQADLQVALKCKFVRCNPDDLDFNIFEFLGHIMKLIMG